MVNYESPERQEHQRILVHTTALVADCMDIEVWEDFFCINQLIKPIIIKLNSKTLKLTIMTKQVLEMLRLMIWMTLFQSFKL